MDDPFRSGRTKSGADAVPGGVTFGLEGVPPGASGSLATSLVEVLLEGAAEDEPESPWQ